MTKKTTKQTKRRTTRQTAKQATKKATGPGRNRAVAPVRYSAWLSGELGRSIEDELKLATWDVPDVELTRMPRGFLVEANEEIGVLVESMAHAMDETEERIRKRYPVFWREMGPTFCGTIQAILTPQGG